ncbi:MAG: SLC13/DASS family transporter [Crenarchaeota archaeon]|nr:MAG: SLC13/DASS family transporter [Thermoproteota archaeon]RDJ33957.1 MAG: SLC13/DASS family transporter [Thermoproteota archaeon]RDJ36928.1 MAG: SLC13/DASS family transporter [Thermoproteota archaeon]RDJ37537.1 MAG: SLC13/DASS family transporter [Thermoproteota archaeon]
MNFNLKIAGMILGPLLFFIILLIPTPEGMPETAKPVLAISVWMIVWWITEAIPVYATALLPLGLIPLLGVLPVKQIASEYMHPIIVLLLGMFMIALSIEKSGLHKKIAFELISVFGYSPRRIVWGFMITTALISTVVMSTTVVLILLPIAGIILSSLAKTNFVTTKFKVVFMLSIAYSSSIGSVATLIGAPPNLLYAATVMEMFSHRVTFAEWSMLGTPLAFSMLVLCGMYMNSQIGKGSPQITSEIRHTILLEKSQIGKITVEQKTVLGVLLGVLLLMFTIPLWQSEGSLITNSVIAILGGISLFILPKTRSESLMNWAGIERLPFGLLFLLGGGFALSLAFVDSGLADWIAHSLSFVSNYPFELIIIILVAMIMFLTNVKSNTATAAIFIPIVGTMAMLNGWSPLPVLFAITVATSFAFLLPMGTPPNALIYEKAQIPIKAMIKHGIVLNMIAIALISGVTICISSKILI